MMFKFIQTAEKKKKKKKKKKKDGNSKRLNTSHCELWGLPCWG